MLLFNGYQFNAKCKMPKQKQGIVQNVANERKKECTATMDREKIQRESIHATKQMNEQALAPSLNTKQNKNGKQ